MLSLTEMKEEFKGVELKEEFKGIELEQEWREIHKLEPMQLKAVLWFEEIRYTN